MFGVDAAVGTPVNATDVFDGEVEQLKFQHHLRLVLQFGIATPTDEQGQEDLRKLEKAFLSLS